jgi:hypothetical protein
MLVAVRREYHRHVSFVVLAMNLNYCDYYYVATKISQCTIILQTLPV